MDPVLGAAARGEVAMFTPLDTELYGSKAAVAMLSDERNRHLFTSAELASIDAIVPWTRMVRPGRSPWRTASPADLLDYASTSRTTWCSNPPCGTADRRCCPAGTTTPARNCGADQLADAAGGPYVLQRRIRPVPDLFPGPGGEPESWIVAWGVYTGAERIRRHHHQRRHGRVRAGGAQRERGRTRRLLPGDPGMTGRPTGTLTAAYLAEVARQALTGRDLLSVLPRTGMLAAGAQRTRPVPPAVPRPAESQRLNADLQHVRAALVSLPDRLFGGDLAASAGRRP